MSKYAGIDVYIAMLAQRTSTTWKYQVASPAGNDVIRARQMPTREDPLCGEGLADGCVKTWRFPKPCEKARWETVGSGNRLVQNGFRVLSRRPPTLFLFFFWEGVAMFHLRVANASRCLEPLRRVR